MSLKIVRTHETGSEDKTYTYKIRGTGKRPCPVETTTYTQTWEWCLVTMDGETRRVKAIKFGGEHMPNRYQLESVFAAMTRCGNKVHQVGLTIELEGDIVHIFNSVSLNRQARITGWWKPEYDAENGAGSKHIGG